MKKRILILSASALFVMFCSFGVNQFIGAPNTTGNQVSTVYGCTEPQQNQTDFIFDVSSRFVNVITKEKILTSTSIFEFLPVREYNSIKSVEAVEVTAFYEDGTVNKRARHFDERYNDKQLEILRSLDYSDNFSITGSIHKMHGSGQITQDTLVYYMTVVPETPPIYKDGKEELITYFKSQSRDVVQNSDQNRLSPGKISFTVTHEGKVANARLNNSCGYSGIDARMMKLVGNIPGEWEAARDLNGKRVDVELILFFGQIGC